MVVVWSQLRQRVKINFIHSIGRLKALFIAGELKALKQNGDAVREYLRGNGPVARRVSSVTPMGRSRRRFRGSPKVRLIFPSRQRFRRSHGDMRSGSGGGEGGQFDREFGSGDDLLELPVQRPAPAAAAGKQPTAAAVAAAAAAATVAVTPAEPTPDAATIQAGADGMPLSAETTPTLAGASRGPCGESCNVLSPSDASPHLVSGRTTLRSAHDDGSAADVQAHVLIRLWCRIVCPDPRRRQRVEAAAASADEDEEAGPPAKRQRTLKDMWGGKVPGGAVVGLRA